MGQPEGKEALRPPSSHTMAGSTATTIVPPSQTPSVIDKDVNVATDSKSESGPDTSAPPTAVVPSKDTAEVEVKGDVAENALPSDDEVEYPTSWKLGLITIALCLAVFCMALDNTIIATAIPKITTDFSSLDDIGWYGSSYLLASCSFQLIFGKLYTFYSIKWTYMTALFIFELGSLICGVAPNSTALIIGRAIAGLGGAGIFSGSILIVAASVPLRQRPTYTGFIGGVFGIASVAGPLMGGAFTDNLTWRWCFYINLPFGAVTAMFIFVFFKSPPRAKVEPTFRGKVRNLDLEGTAVFLPGIICLLLALQWGGSEYNWGNARIIVLFILFALLIAAFVGIQFWKQERATIPPRVFKNRNVWGSALFGGCLGASFFILIFYVPIYFQAIKGVSAVKSGIMNIPMVLSLVLFSIIAGILVTVVGYYTPFMFLSSILMAVGAGMLTTFTPHTAHPAWIGYQVLFGFGVGFGMQQTLIAVQASLPGPDIPIATALMMFAQMLGGALFVSVGQNVFTNQLFKNLASVPGIDPKLVVSVGATDLQSAVRNFNEALLAPVLEAYSSALTQTWYVSVAMAVFSIVGAAFVEWKSVKGKNIEMGGGA
ncbi:MFS transporter [Eremomyces bilateralis CBS 781.70]|uniref:MFS transporter n=1 Tax=Eremomyces bilateralis CBS 781.70 TaxID=1392243 RepID=A0A6G1GBD1_9PEZI|nr:MFS transporter [Eremomyces bilateralis CBS 781.70]KAF1815159.1 MFS transporter [Eremomyces bilateralis CBS 781.70]